jgi:hypothetical protein
VSELILDHVVDAAALRLAPGSRPVIDIMPTIEPIGRYLTADLENRLTSHGKNARTRRVRRT